MRVVLINPPVPNNKVWVREGRCQQLDIWGAPFPPLSLALISTQLKKEGIETLIIDSGPEAKNVDQVIRECIKFKPDVAIIATTTPTIETDLGWFLPKINKKIRSVKTAAIGIHVSVMPRETLKQFELLDYVIMGEPEITALELVKTLIKKEKVVEVEGLGYRDKKGEVVINKSRKMVEDVDSLGLPDWDKINFKNYLLPIINKPFSLISFSRGCPYNCRFCNAHVYGGKKIRVRKVKNIIKEIKYNLSLGVNQFLFWTESMTGNKEFLNEFLEAILKENLQEKMAWVCNSRVDNVDFELFRKMKKAGCWQIAFGFEFGSNQILELAQKGTTVEQGRKAAQSAVRAGILVDGHFILGFPGENEKSLKATIDLAKLLPLTFAHFYAATPFPGSEIYRNLSETGMIGDDWKLFSQNGSAIKTDWLMPELINSYIRRAYRNFYLRPIIILRILGIPKTLGEFKNLIGLILKFGILGLYARQTSCKNTNG